MRNMQTFHRVAMVFNSPNAIFRVRTRDRGEVLMRILPGMPGVEGLRDALTEYVTAVRNTMGVREFNVGRV